MNSRQTVVLQSLVALSFSGLSSLAAASPRLGECLSQAAEVYESPLASISPNPARSGDVVTVKFELPSGRPSVMPAFASCDGSFRLEPSTGPWPRLDAANGLWEVQFQLPKVVVPSPLFLMRRYSDIPAKARGAVGVDISVLGQYFPLTEDSRSFEIRSDILALATEDSPATGRPDSIRNLRAIVGRKDAVLRWDMPSADEIVGFLVFGGSARPFQQISRSIVGRNDFSIEPSTTHVLEFRVVGVDRFGRLGALDSAPSVLVAPIAHFSPPERLRVIRKSSGSVTIGWEHSGFPRLFRVHRSYIDPLGNPSPRKVHVETRNSFFEDRWLTISSTYTYSVSAVSVDGEESAPSEPLFVNEPDLGPPGAVSDFSVEQVDFSPAGWEFDYEAARSSKSETGDIDWNRKKWTERGWRVVFSWSEVGGHGNLGGPFKYEVQASSYFPPDATARTLLSVRSSYWSSVYRLSEKISAGHSGSFGGHIRTEVVYFKEPPSFLYVKAINEAGSASISNVIRGIEFPKLRCRHVYEKLRSKCENGEGEFSLKEE